MTKPRITQVVFYSPAENDQQARGPESYTGGHYTTAIVTRVLDDGTAVNLDVLVAENKYDRNMVHHRDYANRQPDAAYWLTAEEVFNEITAKAKQAAVQIEADAHKLGAEIVEAANNQAAIKLREANQAADTILTDANTSAESILRDATEQAAVLGKGGDA